MFLTADEIENLTAKQRRAAQRVVLNALGIQHKVRPDGSLAVLRSHVEREFGGALPAGAAKKPQEPNWDMVNA
jgi:hypothetical protein